MSELRRDPIVGRWVIVDNEHPSKPEDYEYEPNILKGGVCPFCYGNEGLTPPEIEVIRDPHTGPNSPGWNVRVVANKFPALQIEGDLDRRGIGIYDMSNGVGAHEVIIETPYHHKDICDLAVDEISNFLRMYSRRMMDLAKDQRFKYLMLFKNYGAAAGASLEHPHTQLVALPMIPKNATEEIKGAQAYFEFRERCIFCDMIRQELQDDERMVLENKYFVSFCPFISRFPFEVWIMPKQHDAYFYHMTPDMVPLLASLLKETIAKLKVVFPNLSYNFILHSSPINGDAGTEGYHWHIEFMPKLMRTAGFEWGSGFYLVPTPPELAAQYLKDAKVQQ